MRNLVREMVFIVKNWIGDMIGLTLVRQPVYEKEIL